MLEQCNDPPKDHSNPHKQVMLTAVPSCLVPSVVRHPFHSHSNTFQMTPICLTCPSSSACSCFFLAASTLLLPDFFLEPHSSSCLALAGRRRSQVPLSFTFSPLTDCNISHSTASALFADHGVLRVQHLPLHLVLSEQRGQCHSRS